MLGASCSPRSLVSAESVSSFESAMAGKMAEACCEGGLDRIARLLLRAGGAGFGEPFGVAAVRFKLGPEVVRCG